MSLRPTSKQNFAVQVRNRYGNESEFLTLFNPSKQNEYCRRLERCFTGGAPSLNLLEIAYSPAVAESWIECQLKDLSEFSGCKEKLTVQQIEQIGQTICLHFGDFKVTELMIFFQRFKAGQYGKFYGAVDGLVVTEALQEFRPERIDYLKKLQRNIEKRERDHLERERLNRSKDLMTKQEWDEIKWLFNM